MNISNKIDEIVCKNCGEEIKRRELGYILSTGDGGYIATISNCKNCGDNSPQIWKSLFEKSPTHKNCYEDI